MRNPWVPFPLLALAMLLPAGGGVTTTPGWGPSGMGVVAAAEPAAPVPALAPHFAEQWTWRDKGRDNASVFHFTRKKA